jgi:hypothetical protein
VALNPKTPKPQNPIIYMYVYKYIRNIDATLNVNEELGFSCSWLPGKDEEAASVKDC